MLINSLKHNMIEWIVERLPSIIHRERGGSFNYLITIILFVIALIVRFKIAPVNAGLQYVTFFPAITLAAVVGGLWPGLFATVIGLCLATFIFTPPYFSFSFAALSNAFGSNIVFFMDGLIVSASIEAMHRFRARYATELKEANYAKQLILDHQIRLDGLIDAAMDAIISTDETQHIIIFNHGAEQMFGYRATDIIGQHLNVLLPERYREKHGKHVDLFGQTGITSRTMNQPGQSFGLRANGEEFPFEASISRAMTAGSVIYTAILRDITLRKEFETELRIAAAAFESNEGMMITDAKGIILRVNPAFTETTGFTSEEAVGNTPRILKSGRHDEDFYRAMWNTIHATGTWQGEVWDRKKSGEVYPKWLTITAVKGNHGEVTHYVGTHLDITERKAAEDKIKNLAYYDPLTELPNRRLLLAILDQALISSKRSGRTGALLFIDLDNFKTLNDTLGHDYGDMLLQRVAQRLTTCVREGDTVARLGGDEFVVLLENLSTDSLEAASQTETIGEKILASLNLPYQLSIHEYHSTPSIGAALFASHHISADTLFKQADIAMYQSKKAGRNTLSFFDPKMQSSINARVALEKEMRLAIVNREFQLYYQIQVDSLINHRPVGAEALIRWIHPERGLIPPAEFIPLAEETGLILPIGEWVLETACLQLVEWSKQSPFEKLSIAVNVSAIQFKQANFADQILNVIERTGADPQYLKLELTESMLVSDIESVIDKMAALKAKGVGFALDDFGTGYSSLSYLTRLPLEQLKIDRAFVMNLETTDDSVSICAAIISLAHSLKLKVVAEGIETEAQSYILSTGHLCDYLQGYLYGKPLPIEQFEALVK